MIQGYEQTIASIDKILTGVGDLTPVFDRFYKTYTSNFVKKQFDTEGLFFGYKWASLSKWYEKYKRAIVGNKTILRFTDRLYKASIGQNKVDSFVIIKPRTLSFGIRNIDYAEKHQKGKGVEKREFFFIDGKLPLKALLFLKQESLNYVKQLVRLAKAKGIV